jgi:hypothetical protein
MACSIPAILTTVGEDIGTGGGAPQFAIGEQR